MAENFDLVIVGSGPNGAIIAEQVHTHSPSAKILVIEAGSAITDVAGEHLVEADESAMNASYNDLMRRARQIEYVKGAASMNAIDGDAWNPQSTGVFPAAFFGHNFAEFPGGSVSWNVGGMGVHWTAATPWPYEAEIPDFLPREEWDADQETARRLLRTSVGPLIPDVENPFTQPIFDALREVVPSPDPERSFGYMPMGGVARAGKPFARTGPRDIAPFVFDGGAPAVELRTGLLVTKIEHDGSTVTGLALRDLATGVDEVVRADRFLIAADALRTPQLLWASRIRPDALGVRLNEHASIDGEVEIDAARFGLSDADVLQPPAGEPFIDSLWSPSIGAARPMHGQLMEREFEGKHMLSVGWYCSTEIRPENRIEFSDDLVDELGMPHMTVHFSYSDNDLDEIRRMQDVQQAAANALGTFPQEYREVQPPGASLHYTGTVRMGVADDGTSVVDTDGRVWGFTNLFLAGNGVVPTALTCNSTLTGAILSVRIARAISAEI
ncbi:Glucose-methanol-choline (GMC) oxidoreductase:NAD binding site [Microbacterium esteraromaticum]|uniref:Glucose-methanol-choline (GMC) oxidoreductase:NAD binding site n=1 Tax=Microbacterium esteraromaticum TaxID=57043 RepID=A0A1R4JUG2_9MICO|nr:GMC oxidoreductase [Microbacterium esteraromaticum]SJN35656.1 Glucose-methanol-choline (GMC) oxidoreductase:NAD binding site [Microbacterium esteraromaticum]